MREFNELAVGVSSDAFARKVNERIVRTGKTCVEIATVAVGNGHIIVGFNVVNGEVSVLVTCLYASNEFIVFRVGTRAAEYVFARVNHVPFAVFFGGKVFCHYSRKVVHGNGVNDFVGRAEKLYRVKI